jgi:hypothetical protein
MAMNADPSLAAFARSLRAGALCAAVAVAFDDDRLCVMQEAIQQSGSHGGITREDSRPVFESNVGRNDDRAALTHL